MFLRTLPLVLLLACILPAQTEDAKRLKEATAIFTEVMDTPDKAIPQELLEKAHCAVIIPSLKKGAFIVGAKYGRGFVTCRKAGGVGWSAPGGVRVEGGSVGFQIGGSETDVVMLVMNERGAESLLTCKFNHGGDATVAAGPVGRSVTAQTDATMRAEILTCSRSRGVFAGVSLQGATLRQDDDANKGMYGKKSTNREIVTGDVTPPQDAAPLLAALNKYSSRK
jgi:lipid-binding SYLF domain-containing protein